jgi:hypothetical protein
VPPKPLSLGSKIFLGGLALLVLFAVFSPGPHGTEPEATMKPAAASGASGTTGAAPSPVQAAQPDSRSNPPVGGKRGSEDRSAVTSTSKSMSFEKCLATIAEVAESTGVDPVNIVETSEVRVARFNTSDGSVLVTCSSPDRKMIITRSPHRG